MQLGTRLVVLLIMGIAAVRGVIEWSSSTGGASASLSLAFRWILGSYLLLAIVASGNQAGASFLFELKTSQPFTNQVALRLNPHSKLKPKPLPTHLPNLAT